MRLLESIQTLYPGRRFIIRNDDIDSIEWREVNENFIPPTKEEILAGIDRLRAEFIANRYQRDRARTYPSVVDQLDLIYHGGLDAWKAEIQKVKDKYPKPLASEPINQEDNTNG